VSYDQCTRCRLASGDDTLEASGGEDDAASSCARFRVGDCIAVSRRGSMNSRVGDGCDCVLEGEVAPLPCWWWCCCCCAAAPAPGNASFAFDQLPLVAEHALKSVGNSNGSSVWLSSSASAEPSISVRCSNRKALDLGVLALFATMAAFLLADMLDGAVRRLLLGNEAAVGLGRPPAWFWRTRVRFSSRESAFWRSDSSGECAPCSKLSSGSLVHILTAREDSRLASVLCMSRSRSILKPLLLLGTLGGDGESPPLLDVVAMDASESLAPLLAIELEGDDGTETDEGCSMSRIFSSIVSRMMIFSTITCCDWPIRSARLMAWRSTLSSHTGSKKKMRDADGILMPYAAVVASQSSQRAHSRELQMHCCQVVPAKSVFMIKMRMESLVLNVTIVDRRSFVPYSWARPNVRNSTKCRSHTIDLHVQCERETRGSEWA